MDTDQRVGVHRTWVSSAFSFIFACKYSFYFIFLLFVLFQFIVGAWRAVTVAVAVLLLVVVAEVLAKVDRGRRGHAPALDCRGTQMGWQRLWLPRPGAWTSPTAPLHESCLRLALCYVCMCFHSYFFPCWSNSSPYSCFLLSRQQLKF